MTTTTTNTNLTNSEIILRERYYRKDENGDILETEDDLFKRVAHALAVDEKQEDIFFGMMKKREFLPNSPTLVNAGTDEGCLSACFTLSMDDNLVSIMDTLKYAALIVKSGGGVGFGFSKLRPKGDFINTRHKKALGVIATLIDYSTVLNSLTQSGAFRPAALMGQLHISHPEVRDFIHAKDNFDVLSNFNISVQINDDFMRAVENDGDWNFINPRNNEITSTMKARELFDEICDSAHKSGDPGICFKDRVDETHPNANLGPIHTSNPCGEFYSEDFNSCNLGSINLGKFVTNNIWNYENLRRVIANSVQFLNRVIDVNTFPLEQLHDMNQKTRRIGLGVMGWHDALVKLGISYDSDEAISEAENISSFIYDEAWKESARLAKIDGPFPNYYDSSFLEKKINFDGKPVRNSCVITVAPTGTISRIADCSFGIEPFFDLVWQSKVLWDEGSSKAQMMDCPLAIREKLSEIYGNNKVAMNNWMGNLFLANKNTQKLMLSRIGINPSLFNTAHDVSPEYHVKHQTAWQKNVTNGISKTINMPNNATVQDVKDIYIQAWKENCKGITIYRENTREIEVLNTNNHKAVEKAEIKEVKNSSYTRPNLMHGFTNKITTGHGSLYVTANYDDDGNIREVLSHLGKTGGCSNASLEAVSRLISLALQWNIPENEIIKQLESITCCPMWYNGKMINSPYDGLAKVLSDFSSNNDKPQIKHDKVDISENGHQKILGKSCPECNARTMVNQGGCDMCLSCSYSKCG